MDFLFFNAADKPLFSRNDPESATWTVEERNLQLLFPYNAQKVIERGMRVGFVDETGVFQPFEVRKVKNYEPDHYQEITAEHIVISELTDEHFAGSELTNVTPQAALSGLLAGTLWSVGNVTATNLSSANLGMGSVYQNLRTIETNWNVYITPRVTFDSTGITGRYLDIVPAGGVWRGVRLSIDKNADEMGVTVDDTETLTALFGYGRSTNNVPLNFSSVTWTATADHPAKPSGQTYIEDPAATAAYGRNGRARFGYYQNSDITDANVLLQKTWEALRATNAPRVSIDCMVRDLYRLGYADQPIRLHDTAIVDVEPTGLSIQLEIIRLTVDLLDPTATRPTIGAYIPNIIYINRQTATRASGGRGGGSSGRRGQTDAEQQISEFETEILANQYQISLRAYQRDMTNVENILRAAGISIDAQGVAVYADDLTTNLGSILKVQSDAITTEVGRAQQAESGLSSRITQEADRISLVVSDGSNPAIKAASIAAAINASGSSVTIDADKIYLNGTTSVSSLLTGSAQASKLWATEVQANTVNVSGVGQGSGLIFQGNQVVTVNALSPDGTTYRPVLATSLTGTSTGLSALSNAIMGFGTATESGGQITIPTTKLDSTAGPSINFNIAATQFYQDGVAAAEASGAAGVTLGAPSWGSNTGANNNTFTVTASNGRTSSQGVFLAQGSWSNGSKNIYIRTGSGNGTTRATGVVVVGSASNWQISYTAQGETVSVTVAGTTFTHTFST